MNTDRPADGEDGEKTGLLNEEQKASEDGDKKQIDTGPKDFKSMPKIERKKYNIDKRFEFAEKLKQYRFFLACLFYEDNIGRVEVRVDNGALVEDTFRIPAYVKLLTQKTRDTIPTLILQVSQQEKLNFF